MPVEKWFGANAQSNAVLWQVAVIFFLSLIIRLIGIGTTPIQADELYHLLASQSWQTNGNFKILDGEYTRAGGFTALIGVIHKLHGGDATMLAARIPSIMSGAMLCALLFTWLSKVADNKVAWVGALLFSFAHFVVTISQFARFYALHALLIFVASMAIYSVVVDCKSYWRLLVAGVVVLFAFHLQVTTAIALVALGAWALVDWACQPYGRSVLKNMRYRSWLLVLATIGLVIGWYFLDKFLPEFRYAPLWAEQAKDNVLYYYTDFRLKMPILSQLFPLAVIAALSRWSRPAFFCVSMFAIPMVVHSLGAMKSTRYVYYALPYFFAVWGMAMAVFLPAAFKMVEQAISSFTDYLQMPLSDAARKGGASLLCAVVVFAASLGNPVYTNTFRDLGDRLKGGASNISNLAALPPDPPWTGQTAALKNAIGNPSILVTADDLRTITYLQSYDVLLNASVLSDVRSWQDFDVDFRTGRLMIASAEAVEKLIQCYPDGAILVPESRWRVASGVNPQAADVIEKMAIPSPPVTGFHIFKWQTSNMADNCIAFRQSLKEKRHG